MRGRLTYLQARIFLLLLGFGLAAGQTLLAWNRGAAPTEVLAPALYAPIFAAAIFAFIPGGLIAAALASLVYGVLLADQARGLGLGPFVALLLSRIATFLFYAVVVALGTRYLEGRLRKLELYDQIDDATDLFNSAFLLSQIDLERARASRYETLFSVAELRVPHATFDAMRRRQHQRTLRDFGRRIQAAVRSVDRAGRIIEEDADRFLVVLPQTARAGAEIFVERLRDGAESFLAERGAAPGGRLAGSVIPGDDAAALDALMADITRADERRRAVRTAAEQA